MIAHAFFVVPEMISHALTATNEKARHATANTRFNQLAIGANTLACIHPQIDPRVDAIDPVVAVTVEVMDRQPAVIADVMPVITGASFPSTPPAQPPTAATDARRR